MAGWPRFLPGSIKLRYRHLMLEVMRDMRQIRTFAPTEAMHRNTAWPPVCPVANHAQAVDTRAPTRLDGPELTLGPSLAH